MLFNWIRIKYFYPILTTEVLSLFKVKWRVHNTWTMFFENKPSNYFSLSTMLTLQLSGIQFISNDPPSFFLIQYINDFHEFILNSESFFATMTHFSLPRINNFWANSVRFNYFSCESTISFAIISYISRTFSCFLQPWEISVNSLSFPRAHDFYHYVFGNSP